MLTTLHVHCACMCIVTYEYNFSCFALLNNVIDITKGLQHSAYMESELRAL